MVRGNERDAIGIVPEQALENLVMIAGRVFSVGCAVLAEDCFKDAEILLWTHLRLIELIG